MSQRYEAQMEETSISGWQEFEGQTVDGKFLLRQYLGGTAHSGVFLTDFESGEPQKSAIKLIAETPANADVQLSRWELTKGLSHPNLIRIFQAGRCQLGGANLLYVVTECADEDLSQIVPQRALTPDEARDMLRPALQALSYIHAKGFVHGHIKPANIMGCSDTLKLSTDTLSEMDEPISDLSAYQPPESTASAAGDVWSLGMTLAEVLTQHLPALQEPEWSDPIIPLGLPEPFLAIVRQSLHSDASRRWTVPQIAAYLDPLEAVKEEIKTPTPSAVVKEAPDGSGYLIPVVGGVLLMAVLVLVPRLLKHGANSSRYVPQSSQKANSLPALDQHQAESVQPSPAAPSGGVPSAEQPASVAQESTEAKPAASIETPSSASDEPAKESNYPACERGFSTGSGSPGSSQGAEKARNTIRGTVRVSVRVSADSSGNVVDESLEVPGPSSYFAACIASGTRMDIRAGSTDGGGPADQWVIRFDFVRYEDHRGTPTAVEFAF